MSAIGNSPYPSYGSNPQNPKESPANPPSQLRRDSTASWQKSSSSSRARFSEDTLDACKESAELIHQATEYFEKSPHPDPVECVLEQKSSL